MLGGRVKTFIRNSTSASWRGGEVAGDLAVLDAPCGSRTSISSASTCIRSSRSRARMASGKEEAGGDDRRRRSVHASCRCENFAHVTLRRSARSTTKVVLGGYGRRARLTRCVDAGRREWCSPRRRRTVGGDPRAASRGARCSAGFAPVFEKAPDLADAADPRPGRRRTPRNAARGRTCWCVEQLHGPLELCSEPRRTERGTLGRPRVHVPACAIRRARESGAESLFSARRSRKATTGALAARSDRFRRTAASLFSIGSSSASLGERLAEQFVEVLFVLATTRWRSRPDPEAVDPDSRRSCSRCSTQASRRDAACSRWYVVHVLRSCDVADPRGRWKLWRGSRC